MSTVTDKILLNDGPLLIKDVDETIDEQFTEHTSLRLILKWYERHIYRHLYLPLCQTEPDTTIKCSHADALLWAIELIYNLEKTKANVYLSALANIFPLKNYTLADESLSLTYDSWTYTLRDLATYSPYAIDGCHLRLLFIVYQLLKIISFIHQRGLSSGPLQLTDIHINERYWIQLKPRFHSSLATVEFTSDCSTAHTNAPIDHHGHDDESQLHSSSPPASRSQSANMPTNSKAKTCISNHSDEAVVVTTITPAALTATTLSQSSVYHVEHRYETYCRTHIDIVELIKQWQLGHVSNFDYLLILNALAGRRFHDPNNHLIFPWINDFTSATQKLRDLSQTKYRLNKGDAQLDLTYSYYSTSISSTTNIVPHHLSEHLSSITYYVYKARRIEKRILCENVRSNWVPHEYPSSIGRLYFWTPEECIPEFFYDASLFQSIHEDLPNLLVPEWCSGPEEFVQKHRQLLESREVSENLHLWIDLIFGHKLTGESAVDAKNVCLPLVDHHDDLRDSGIVQLFLKPHPPRFVSSIRQMTDQTVSIPTSRRLTIIEEEQAKRSSSRTSTVSNAPSAESMALSNALNDTFSHLDSLEQLLMLTSISFGRLPSTSFKNRSPKFTSTFLNACQRDLQYFAVCLLELILLGKQHYVSLNSNGNQRLSTAKHFLNSCWHLIPIQFRACLSVLLSDMTNGNESSVQQQISDRAINVAFFLNRWTTPLPFPFYFEELYRFVHQYEQYDQQLLVSLTPSQQKKIHEKRFQLILTQIPPLLLSLHTQHSHELLMPYILDAFRHPIYGVRCVYSLFNPASVVLGPEESRKQLLPLIQSVLNPEKTTLHHWRCFTRRFIIQLIARFSLNKFLNSFPILLVEACSGFKDEIITKAESDDDNSSTGDSTTDADETATERSDTVSAPENDLNIFESNEEQQQSNLLSDAAADSIIYLQFKLGPVLGCKYFGRHLLRMLALCYVDDEQLQSVSSTKNPFKSIRPVDGDLHAKRIVDCLLSLVQNFGEQIIVLFFFPHLIETIRVASNRLTIRSESALLSSIVLLRSLLPYMSDSTLMAHLSDPIKTRLVHPYLTLLSSNATHFPSFERSRSVCAFRTLDILFLLSLRLGYESTRLNMNDSIRVFFACFQFTYESTEDPSRSRTTSVIDAFNYRTRSPSTTYGHQTTVNSMDGDEYCRITIDSLTQSYKIDSPVKPRNSIDKHTRSTSHSLLTATFIEDDSSMSSNIHTRESIQQEIEATFTGDLACTAFVQFCRLCGDQHMNSLIPRTDTIHTWIAELTSKPDAVSRDEASSSNSANNVLMSIRDRDIRCQTTDDSRFLRKNWLSYWEHEVGRSENTMLSFKQIHLQSFIGHTNAVRSLCVLDDESTFLSGGRDQKLLAWKVENQNDNTIKVESRWAYNGYRKSVFAITFLESLRLAATCDGSVHVVDPFRGQLVCRYAQPKDGLAFSAMAGVPAPSTNVLVATSDGIVRFYDVRTKAVAYEWKTTAGTGGQVKTLAISSNAHAAVIGFSTGTVSVFDVRSGGIMGTLKVPEGEVLKTSFYSRNRFFTSSGDGSIFLWNTRELAQASPTLLKSHLDPAPFVLTTRSGEFIVATQTNKLCIYSNMKGGAQMDCQCTRLQADSMKGTLSSLALLAENRLLLFGSDNGNIELLC